MLFIIANILRVVVMAFITALPLTALQQFFDGTVKELVKAIQDEHGLDAEEAKDILVNILVETAVNATIIGVIIKTKIAVKTAEYLGLTSKGFKTRPLTPKAATAVVKMKGPWEKFKAMSVASKIMITAGLAGTTVWTGIGIANVIEPGIYKPKQTNDLYEKFIGVRPFPEPPPVPQPGPFDANKFRDYAGAIETAGVVGLINPVARQSQEYSRTGLAEIIDYVYGKEILKGNSPSAKQLIPSLAQYLISKKGVTSTAGATIAPSYTPPQVAQVRVFSGVVSQGVIGSTAQFTPRPDDLIEDANELSQASHNNLAPFLAALPSRMSYEIKVVPSVKSASGFTQRGTAQRIISGYNKDGSPKYRTVVNKFATMDIFVRTDKGSQTKITTIVLGPVDSVRFQGANINLGAVAVGVQQNIIAPASVTTPTVAPMSATTTQPEVPTKESGQNVPYLIYKFTPNGNASFQAIPATNTPYGASVADLGEARAWFALNPTALAQQNSSMPFDRILAGEFVDSGLSWGLDTVSKEWGWGTWKAKQAVPVAPQEGPKATEATTLFDYYKAHGQSLPSVQERSVLYEQLALGQAAYYTGTAEQNTKLLAALQGARL